MPGAAVSPEFSFGANSEGDHDHPIVLGEANPNPSTSNDSRALAPVSPKSAADILNALSSSGKASDPLYASQALSGEKNVANPSDKSINEGDDNVSPSMASAIASPSAEMLVKSNQDEISKLGDGQNGRLTSTSTLINIEELELMLYVGQRSWFLSDNDSEFPNQLKQALLINIASALGENAERTHVKSFRWPFFSNQRLPGNDAESVLSLLREWLGEQVIGDTLNGFLMGESISRLLLNQSATEYPGKDFELNISDERGLRVVSTLSLNDLLREPLKKRIAWQHMSSYRAK
jgi:hypothetical protein